MKFITIQQLEAEGTKATGAIWGLNTVETAISTPGEVIINVPRPNGESGNPDELRIAQTWLPQDLTRNITRRRLLRASEFRRAVNGGLVGLITEATALKMLAQPGAREEQQRLKAVADHVKKAGQARTIADTKGGVSLADGSDDGDEPGSTKTTIIDDADRSVADLARDGVEEVEKGIAPPFKMWVDRISAGTDQSAKNEIKGRREFSKAQLGFMHRNLPRKFTTTLAMLAKNLNK